jgi:large subunit ribosomal protein L9
MEVILLERINRLGAVGDVVKVRDGFARNYLIPMKKALRATDANKKVFEEQRHLIEADNDKRRGEAEKHAKKLDKISVSLVRQASEEGKLYGSVSVRDVADQLKAAGHDVPRSQIILSGTIKNTGAYPVRIMLHPEVNCQITVNVVRNESESERHVAAEEPSSEESAA